MKIQVSAPGMISNPDPQIGGNAAQSPETAQFDLPEGATIADVVSRTGVNPGDVELVLVNGEQVEGDVPLSDGDSVALSGRFSGA